MNQRKYDEEIRRIVQSGQIPCSKEYEQKMKELCENLSDEEEQKKGYLLRIRYVLAAAWFCLAMMILPVSASMKGYWKRLQEMKSDEKAKYISELTGSQMNRDTYSRVLSVSERKRKKRLEHSYEQGERYPKGELTHIKKQAQVKSNRLCFLATTSTFFLPARQLTDEELLELIDFNYKREYSYQEELAKAENRTRKTSSAENVSEQAGISREEAVDIGRQWIQKIYGKNVDGWNYSIRKTDSFKNKGYCIYYVTYKESKTNAEYMVTLSNETGKVSHVNCVYNGKKENISKGLSVENKKQLKKRCKEVIGLSEMLDDSCNIQSCSCRYLIDSNKKLSMGIVRFLLKYSDGRGLEVSYSYYNQEYFQIIYLENVIEYIKNQNASRKKYSTKRSVVRNFKFAI